MKFNCAHGNGGGIKQIKKETLVLQKHLNTHMEQHLSGTWLKMHILYH